MRLVQLVAYILEFKAFSSLSVGFLLTAMGAAEDHICITWRSEPFCDEFGPGVRPVFLWETFCFMMQTVNVYIAFLYLPFSGNLAGIVDMSSERLEAELEQQREVGARSPP